jgi:adenosylmethionine---8-amino-7-oxononanoate aminotransferase
MNLQQRDKHVIWHPFTQQLNDVFDIPIVAGKDEFLMDSNGEKYIDAISSWWVNLHGHSHPYIAQKITTQLNTLEHALFSGFTHLPAIELAERLLQKLPSNQSKLFYSDNGSTAVEVALKMAFQYWSNSDKPRTKVIAFENAYHGDTFGGMSVGARNAFNRPFEKLLFDVMHIPVPIKGKENESLLAMQKALNENEIAAFIFEPLVQGAGGMVMYDPSVLDELIKLCKQHTVISIADEVMTGFGRTGTFFASDALQHKPDIVCMSKGLTGGFMPLGITSCAAFIHTAFISNDKMKTFFHGHSYTGNPTACAAALASLDLMELPQTNIAIERIAKKHAAFLQKLKTHKALIDARQLGTILAFEIKTDDTTHYLNALSECITAFFISKKIILRPLGNIVYVLPPYCISDESLDTIYNAITDFLNTL